MRHRPLSLFIATKFMLSVPRVIFTVVIIALLLAGTSLVLVENTNNSWFLTKGVSADGHGDDHDYRDDGGGDGGHDGHEGGPDGFGGFETSKDTKVRDLVPVGLRISTLTSASTTYLILIASSSVTSRLTDSGLGTFFSKR